MTVALVTEADANPGESEYLAARLSGDGVRVLLAAGTEVTEADPRCGSWCHSSAPGSPPSSWTGIDHIDTAEAARRGIGIRKFRWPILGMTATVAPFPLV